MRCFVAIDLPGDIRKKIYEAGKELRDYVVCKWDTVNKIHITLKFLGEINDYQLKDVDKVLSELAENYKPFELELKGAGAFPSENYIKVLWVGGDNISLAEKLNDDLYKAGFTKDKHVTHATFGRCKKVLDKKKLGDFFEKYRNEVFGKFEVNEIVLYKSDLKPTGAVYTVIKKYSLK